MKINYKISLMLLFFITHNNTQLYSSHHQNKSNFSSAATASASKRVCSICGPGCIVPGYYCDRLPENLHLLNKSNGIPSSQNKVQNQSKQSTLLPPDLHN